MKKTIIILAAIAIAFSCTRETPSNPFSKVNDSGEETFEAGVLRIASTMMDDDSKTYLSSDKYFRWVKEDRITILDDKGNAKNSEKAEVTWTAEGKNVSATVPFLIKDWQEGAVPKYAVYNTKMLPVGEPMDDITVSDNNINVTVPAEQQAVEVNSIARHAPVLLAKVENGGDIEDPSYTAAFKHLTGYVRFSLGFEDIQSVTLGSVEEVDLAGKVSVTTSSIDGGTPEFTVIEGSKTVTFTPRPSASAGSGVQINGVWCLKGSKSGYFNFAVLPGSFTPKITMIDKDGNSIVRTASKKITVTRAGYFDLGIIDAPGNFVLEVVKEKSVAITDPAIPSLTSKKHFDSFKINIEDTDYVFGLEPAEAEIGKNGNGLYLSTAKPVIVKLPEKEGYTLSSIYITPGNKIAGSVRLSSKLGGVTTDGTLYYISNEGDGTNKSEGNSSNPTGAGLREVTINVTDEYDADRIYYLKTGTGWSSNCLADFILTYSPLPIK